MLEAVKSTLEWGGNPGGAKVSSRKRFFFGGKWKEFLEGLLEVLCA